MATQRSTVSGSSKKVQKPQPYYPRGYVGDGSDTAMFTGCVVVPALILVIAIIGFVLVQMGYLAV